MYQMGLKLGAEALMDTARAFGEVGNHLFDMDLLDDSGVNPYTDVLTLEDYRRIFGYIKRAGQPPRGL